MEMNDRTVRSKVHTNTLNRDVAPIGDDIESMEEFRADYELGNEDEEAEIHRVKLNPTSRERNKDIKI